MTDYSHDYLLDKQIKIFQPIDGYRASSDAVFLSSMVYNVKEHQKILDLGSGTGAIALCLAHRFPNAKITGLEIQPQLVELSNMSATANGFNNLHFINCDISTISPEYFNQYDYVVTNPPYASDDMPSPNIGKATAHNFCNFDLGQWLTTALKCLRPHGYIFTINRAAAIDEILSTLYHHAGAVKIVPLFSKTEQPAKRVIICARKGDKTPTQILSGITVHNSDGTYTNIARKLLRDGKSFFE